MAPDHTQNTENPWWKKLGWFVIIYGLSIATILVVAYGIRFWLGLG
ncbi:MAG: DUF2474 domain-containing protein [Pseudomonadota bacterium]